jgi:lysophospholipase
MRSVLLALVLVVVVCLTQSVAIRLPPPRQRAIRRQQSSASAPIATACPTGQAIRSSTDVGSDEAAFIERRIQASQDGWTKWLSNSKGPNLDAADGISGGVSAYTSNTSNLPRVAIAMSGGGLRAMVSTI